MKKSIRHLRLLIWCLAILSQPFIAVNCQPGSYKNIWREAPRNIPYNTSIDAPLMGNGNITMSVGYKGNCLRYYLSKNDFWRLRSQADNLSGPRVVGFLDISIDGFNTADFQAEQLIRNGITTCRISKNGVAAIEAKSWVSATENLIMIELGAVGKEIKTTIKLTDTVNKQARLNIGTAGNIQWLTRAFVDSVDISTEAAVALKIFGFTRNDVVLIPGRKLVLALCIESKFKNKDPLKYVLSRIGETDQRSIDNLRVEHIKWWDDYWKSSSVFIDDTVLMKAWYKGLYTMASCSRDPEFPPGLFGWTTTDTPAWNGDYHLNYNFQAPFYSLYSSNHLEQAIPHDAPLLDFMNRGEWYALNAQKTRGIMYPVGIGPLGIEVTRNFSVGGYQKSDDIELEGLFYGQRSNAAYGLVNMAQCWRCTYDLEYGRKIYPYALAVVSFWEDYLKYENGRYVIYADAIHEGSGKDMNPVLSLGLIRNAFDLILDLSRTLGRDTDRQTKWKDILLKISSFPVQTRNGRTVFRYTEKGLDWVDGNGLGIQHIYPSNAIHLDSDPELLVVARNTIDEMQRWHDMNTSNSFFVAAIRVGYDPLKILKELHKYALNINPNGFQLNNPHGIENSCTVTNALNEMLCMSVGNVIRLFGNFPSDINAGFDKLRCWGAFLVSATLKDGIISGVKIFSEKGRNCTIVNPWPGRKVQLIRNGKSVSVLEGSRFSFDTSVNELSELVSL
jgi:alpha-L-fucosidase 2